ncbi:uncharacterized protein LOC117065585 isoform X2 [Trachypithecus francoisi]|uniref:uncharacterized protein LOC117065585 isoform X2 n=1 Tax=Trachypithecus francoisi TaxID=54180 RepID=UPI00141AAE51|nr:uncharacterized protein LOC117065585 isoform X2 [Trachypithecus francoisi]
MTKKPGLRMMRSRMGLAGKLWSNYLASPSWFSLLQNEDIQAATSQNDSHPCLPKPADRRQRVPRSPGTFPEDMGSTEAETAHPPRSGPQRCRQPAPRAIRHKGTE